MLGDQAAGLHDHQISPMKTHLYSFTERWPAAPGVSGLGSVTRCAATDLSHDLRLKAGAGAGFGNRVVSSFLISKVPC